MPTPHLDSGDVAESPATRIEDLLVAMDAADIGYFDLDLRTGRVDRTLQHDRAFGYDSKLDSWSVGRMLEHVHPDDRERVATGIDRTARTGDDLSIDCRVVWPDDTTHWIWARGGVLRDDGAPARIRGFISDVTEWRDARASRAEAYDEVQKALRLRDDVLAIISHDLRNPLHAISLNAEAIAEDLPEGTGARRLDAIRESTRQMEHLIDDLLEVSRLEAGATTPELRPVEVKKLLSEVRARYADAAADNALDFECEPARYEDAPRLRADQGHLLRVFDNLIDNAIEHTDRGGSITVTAQVDTSDVRFSVADTGAGIPEDVQPRIFERYWQAKRTGRGGAGLGLAIVQGIVDAHGGEVDFESTPDVGTTFHFTVPTAE